MLEDLEETRIDADQVSSGRQWADLWDSRELTWLLARREVQLRYRHSFAGIGWAVLQPLLTVVVLTIFQLFVGRPSSSGVPYPLYAMTGLVPWTFLGHAVTQSSSSILKYTSVVTKVYLPLLILPVTATMAASADFIVALPLVALLMLHYGYAPGSTLVLLPIFIVHLVLFTGALGIWLALLNTKFRDTADALPFVMQLWFFLTPIAYPASQFPHRWEALAGLNPMVGILEGFRWALFGKGPAQLGLWLECSWAITLILLASGIFVFLRQESTLVESI